MIFATKNNNFEMVRILLSYNGDPTITSDAGLSSYTLAKLKTNSLLTQFIAKAFVEKVLKPLIAKKKQDAPKPLLTG